MGHAMIQCRVHKDHAIGSACKCVTAKVIIPVAVKEVNACNSNIVRYLTVNPPRGPDS
jgi:hypothetical protein